MMNLKISLQKICFKSFRRKKKRKSAVEKSTEFSLYLIKAIEKIAQRFAVKELVFLVEFGKMLCW